MAVWANDRLTTVLVFPLKNDGGQASRSHETDPRSTVPKPTMSCVGQTATKHPSHDHLAGQSLQLYPCPDDRSAPIATEVYTYY